MQPTALLVFLGLVASAVANPVANPDADVLQKRAGCPNTGSAVACDNACYSVVMNACRSCGGNPSCEVACQSARFRSCYACCDARCTTC